MIVPRLLLLFVVLNTISVFSFFSKIRVPLVRFQQLQSSIVEHVNEKNYLLLDKFKQSKESNLSELADSFVSFCDESFDNYLNEQISSMPTETEKQALGKIRYEINSARKRKLKEADKMLRGVLSAGGIKEMEAKLRFHLKRSEIDMAFMVILQLNIEDAQQSNSEVAVQVMTHLRTKIQEFQDDMVSPPVRLMRLLMRTESSEIRQEMMRKKLLVDERIKTAYYARVAAYAPAIMATGSACGGSQATSSSCASTPDTACASATTDVDGSSVTPSLEQQAQEMTALAQAQCEHIVIESPRGQSATASDHGHDHSHDHEHANDPFRDLGPADVEVQALRDTIEDVIAQV